MASEIERLSCIALLLRNDWSKQASLRAALVESVRPSEMLKANDDAGHWLGEAEYKLSEWESEGLQVVTYADAHYPAQLRDVHDFPIALFWRGQLWESRVVEPAVAIVGSRDASDRATETAAWVASRLGDSGVSVVSGLAKGVDAAAHNAALAAHGRPVGVIGTGIDKSYPKENSALQNEVASSGLLISQFKPGSSPTKQSFPMRNVVMSAFSSATLIIEASEKSGTKHQAEAAVRHGRPLVLSSAVVRTTTWGRKFADMGKDAEVVVASTPREALDAVTDFALRSRSFSMSLV